MKKIITSAVALVALLAFAVPASAQIAFVVPASAGVAPALGPSCFGCDQGSCAWEDWHEDASGPEHTGWSGFSHIDFCRQWTCSQDHTQGCGSASAEEVIESERMKEILNTMEGDARVLALVVEFPEMTHLTPGGDAIEVLGTACDEARLIGRLKITMRQAAVVIDAKSSYLASR